MLFQKKKMPEYITDDLEISFEGFDQENPDEGNFEFFLFIKMTNKYYQKK